MCGYSLVQMDNAEDRLSDEAKERMLYIILFIVLYHPDNATMTNRLEYVKNIMDPSATLVSWLQSHVMPRYEQLTFSHSI